MEHEDRGAVNRPPGITISSGVRACSILAVLLALAALLVLAGCVTDTQGSGNSHQAPKLLVNYTRSGGIAGLNDRLVIFENGQAVYSRGNKTGEFTVPPAQLSELQTILQGADFPSLAPSYPAPSPGADYFHYTIEYQGKTVSTETGGVPDALLAVIGRLDKLLADYAPLS